MATTTFDLQRQIKDNTRQYQDFVNNLNNWQVEISALDAQTTETSLAAEPYDRHPVRSREVLTTGQDEEISAMFSKTEEQQMKQRAVIEKNKGNNFFKTGKYDLAIDCYSAAMKLDPADAVLSANRAIAFIKKEKFKEAEADCNTCLALDPTFVKAYHRRGTARAALGDFDRALSDFKKVLSLEPHNKAAQTELQRLEASMQNQPETKSTSNTLAELSLRALKLEHPSLVVEKRFLPATPVQVVAEHQKIIVLCASGEEKNDELVRRLIDDLPSSRAVASPPSAALPSQTVPQLPSSPPNTYHQFYRQWRTLQQHGDLQLQYLKLIEPSKLKDVFQESLETDVLAGIVAVLTRDQFVASGDRCLLAWLLGLAQVKRVRAVTLFLPSDRKSQLERLIESVRGQATQEQLQLLYDKLV